MRALRRGAWRGAGYGLAFALVETAWNARFLVRNNFGSPLETVLQGAFLVLALGALLGAASAPLLRLRGGAVWHLAAVALAWAGLQVYAAPQAGSFLMLSLIQSGVALVLALIGVGVARRFRPVPAVAGALLLAAAIAAPEINARWGGAAEPEAPQADGAAQARAPAGAPDVVVIVLDTVRARNVSAYGYERETTPRFDELAAQGALFLDASAPATWSLPSHASLFTGLFPSAHGAHSEHRYLDPGPPTLAEVLAEAGWETRCFTANPWISDGLGLTRGFEESDESWREGAATRGFLFIYRLLDRLGFGVQDKGGGAVAESFEQWAASRPPDAPPAFAFLNFLEAHFPYHQVPDEFLEPFTSRSRSELRALSLRLVANQFGNEPVDPAEAAEPATAMYDAGVLYTDHLLGRVVDALRRRGTLDRTLLVVLSDHGELLGEHGAFGHGRSLYQPMIRVPLLVRYPQRIEAGARVQEPVSTVGVYATVLDLLGMEPPAPVHVGSLLPALEGRPAGAPVLAERFAEPDAPALEGRRELLREDIRQRAYREGTHKLIRTTAGSVHVFDLAADPQETRNLAPAMNGAAERLKEELRTWRAALALPSLDADVDQRGTPDIDPAAREQLRALGYIE